MEVIKKIKNMFKKKPAHIKLFMAMAKYAEANNIQLHCPQGRQLSPGRIGKMVGQQIQRDFWTGKV